MLLLVDMLEYLEIDVFQTKTKKIIEIFALFAGNSDFALKEATFYGFGLLSQSMKNFFEEFCEKITSIFEKALN